MLLTTEDLIALLIKGNEDQPRDERGRWVGSGGGDSSAPGAGAQTGQVIAAIQDLEEADLAHYEQYYSDAQHGILPGSESLSPEQKEACGLMSEMLEHQQLNNEILATPRSRSDYETDSGESVNDLGRIKFAVNDEGMPIGGIQYSVRGEDVHIGGLASFGKGVGSSLLKAGLRDAQATGATTVHGLALHGALAFYEKIGFERMNDSSYRIVGDLNTILGKLK